MARSRIANYLRLAPEAVLKRLQADRILAVERHEVELLQRGAREKSMTTSPLRQ